MYKFASKCVKNQNTQDIFPPKQGNGRGRQKEAFVVPMARKERLFRSAVPTMARMLNNTAK